MDNGVILAGMILYFLTILGMGIYFSRVEMTREKYMLGEGKIPGWVLAFSERATGSSAWLLLGFTGFTFATGLSAIWMRSEEHTSELQSRFDLVCRLLLEKKKTGRAWF